MPQSTFEMLETLDASGQPAGLYPRGVVHRSGLWHRSVNVILLTPDDEMILQQRSHLKDVCPGAWDLSVAEHLQPGESFYDAALRGLEEELSLKGIVLAPFGGEISLRYEPEGLGIKDFEIQRLFVGRTDRDPRCGNDEVAATRRARLEELMQIRTNTPETLTPWFTAWLGVLEKNGFDCTDWPTGPA